MKRILKYIAIIFGAILLILICFIWFNLHNPNNDEDLLADLPTNVTPKYGENEANNWWKQTSVYQIYPRSYMDSDGDGIGDLNGIISKLDYIESLGFETLWLSPFFNSPQEDHGYDISDFQNIQPEYGDLAIVDSLIAEVHKRDMKIVFDLVLNHTSDQHPWFLESKSSQNNPKNDWYVWQDGQGDDPPNNWKNILGQISGWNYVPERDQYYYAAFLPFQPDLNMSNPEVKEAIFDMVKFWLDKDVDGFRLDIFNFIFEDQNFPDNPRTLRYLPNMNEGKWLFEDHKYNFHQPEVIEFAKELRQVLESYPDGRFMVGEVFGSHRHMRELLGLENLDGLNLVFLFDFLDNFEFSADYFREKTEAYEAFYPAPLVPTYVFGNHDQARSIARLDNDTRKAEVLASFQFTMRGVPFTYQGEEIGMKNGEIPLTEAQDPLAAFWLKLPKWISENTGIIMNRDNCRTPMQWSNETAAGFSKTDDTWLPVQKDYRTINVEDQLQDQNSLLQTYKELLALRKRYPVLKNGALKFINHAALPEDVLAYTRKNGDHNITVYLNYSEKGKILNTDFDGQEKVLFSKRAQIDGTNIELDPFGLLIFLN
ncbi:MAG: alpha-glucosidase [Aureibaculum sp.]|nr:alpha-glucosidase [Aureibaculum sp.]